MHGGMGPYPQNNSMGNYGPQGGQYGPQGEPLDPRPAAPPEWVCARCPEIVAASEAG